MTSLREAAQQALESLEALWQDGPGGFPTAWHSRAITAVTALRAALEQPEPDPEPVAWMQKSTGVIRSDWHFDKSGYVPLYAVPPLEPAPEPAPEPVAWRIRRDGIWSYRSHDVPGLVTEPLYAVPPITQTAIEKWKRMANVMGEYHKPLSDDALWAMWDADLHEDCPDFREFKHAARAVEAAHGIKDET